MFFNQASEIISRCKNIEIDKFDENVSQSMEMSNTIIGVVGERGTGKSSLMGTAINALKADNHTINMLI